MLIACLRRHSLVAFFTLAYAISWGFFSASSRWPEFPFLFPFGSMLAALTVAAVTHGTAGLKDILRRCLLWRVSYRWYLSAVLVPAAIALSVFVLNFRSSAVPAMPQLGPWYKLLLLFPLAMFDAPLQEHIGWHGYAMPRFSRRRSALSNSLILGLLLAGWHLPLALSAGASLLPYLIATIASAVVTNWIYYNSNESALLPILYHTSANAIGMYLLGGFKGSDLVRSYWLLAGVNCVVAILVVYTTGSRMTYSSEGK